MGTSQKYVTSSLEMLDSSSEKTSTVTVSKKICYLLCFLFVVSIVVVAVAVYYGHPDRQSHTATVAPADESTTTATTQVITSPTTSSTTPLPTEAPDIRIPSYFVPIQYNVRIRPDIYGTNVMNFTFNGTVEMTFKVTMATKEVIIHWRKLAINTNQIRIVVNGTAQPTSVPVDYSNIKMESPPTEFLRIPTTVELVPDMVYTVYIEYMGKISRDLAGIYLSTYINANNQPVHILTSQLQATDARKVFPCMDEPALKAVFTVTIERKAPFHSKSNMDIYKMENLADGWIADYYNPTPIMSTYLLAFLVSDFECVQRKTKTNVTVEICARPNAIDQTAFANSIAVEIQEWFEEYHDLPYPLEKTTHCAIPDFAAGAMENWGLIMYRESSLLYDPATSSALDKQFLTKMVAHEVAHMWFGNLVSPGWWDEIWLNEGFASFMEIKGVNNAKTSDNFNSWQLEEQYVVDELQDVMREDATVMSHPVYVEVSDPARIGTLFDHITYIKGAGVIRMMHNFLGGDVFQRGISNYLKNNTYKSVTHTDLFNFLTKEAAASGLDVDVSDVMLTWIKQMGFPVVMYDYNSTNGQLTLEQKHFLADPSQQVTTPSPYNYTWKVPINYWYIDGNGNEKVSEIAWLNTQKKTLMNVSDLADFIIGNVNESFYYRVNYNARGWAKIAEQLKNNHTKIPLISRAQLIDDSFSLANAGEIDPTKALEITRYIDMEEQLVPWLAFSRYIDYFRVMLHQTEANEDLKKYMQSKTKSVYYKLGWVFQDYEHQIDQLLGKLITGMSCRFDFQDCREHASMMFKSWMENNTKVNPNTAAIVYCLGIAEGGLKAWTHAYTVFLNSNSGTEKAMLLTAMGCSEEPWILQRYLEWSLSGDKGIRLQDIPYTFVGVSRNQMGSHIAWNFLKTNWKIFYDRFYWAPYPLSYMINTITSRFSSDWELADLEGFYKSLEETGPFEMQFQFSIETTKTNMKWRANNEDAIVQWLKANSSG